jgi:RimJ/RimL family protein N-acetyltransferase
LVKIAEDLYASYPSVKYYAYGTYFGARAPMRKFKRKFQFFPYHVHWILQSPPRSGGAAPETFVYRRAIFEETPRTPLAMGSFLMTSRTSEISDIFPLWRQQNSLWGATRNALKVASGRSIFFAVIHENQLIHTGWAHLGFCRHYSVEPDAVVLGDMWTAPEYRDKGTATGAARRVINILMRRGFHTFYIAAEPTNTAAQKLIATLGFFQRVNEG